MNQGLKLALALATAAGIGGWGQRAPAAAPDYQITSRIPGPDGGFDIVSFDPAHRRVYISRSDGLTAVDVNSGQMIGHLADGQRTHAPVVLSGGASILLTNAGDNSAHLLDAASGRLVATIPTAEKPDAAILDSATGLVLVMTHSGAVTEIDPGLARAVGDIAVGGALEFAATDGKGRAYVNVEDKNEIAVLDIRRRTVLKRYPLAGCDGPTGLAYDAKTGLLVSSCGNNVAKVLRASTGQEVASLAIGKGPDTVMLDAGRRLALIPCGWDGVLDVIDLSDPRQISVVATVKTQPGARTGDLDPKTGRLYLPTATYTLEGGRPQATPGTFQVLVLSPSS